MQSARLNLHIYKWAGSKACNNEANVHKEMFITMNMDTMLDFEVAKVNLM